MTATVSAARIWALGTTQIVGYGSLYYAFSVLAPSVGASLSLSQEWLYGALSAALLAGGVVSPLAGQLVDRFGARITMTIGSVLCAGALAGAALAPNGWAFGLALVAMEIMSTLVLYAAAFAALVQLAGAGAQRNITHLTLIAGFASTLFWPLTSFLLNWTDWRGVLLAYAALNLALCTPLHWWIAKPTQAAPGHSEIAAPPAVQPTPPRSPALFALLMCGFAIEGFTLSAILMHIAPLLTHLQLGPLSILITTLFGPAQVLSRTINMGFGKGLRQVHLGIITAVLPPLAIGVLALFAPSPLAGVAFAVLFGLGSGLTSIVSGSLPLELFGRDRYGTRLGWLSSARQVASAISPFIFAVGMASIGVVPSLAVIVALGAVGVALFTLIAIAVTRRSETRAPVQV